MDTVEVLKRARDRLAPPYAWCRGVFTKRDNRAPGGKAYCAEGALLIVTRSARDFYEAKTVLREIIGVDGIRDDIPDWNDDHRIQKRDVLSAFNKAIKRASA